MMTLTSSCIHSLFNESSWVLRNYWRQGVVIEQRCQFRRGEEVFNACVITAEMVAVIASTSTDTVPGDELEGFEAITLACSVVVLS